VSEAEWAGEKKVRREEGLPKKMNIEHIKR
jgi:hypothetical protein